MRAEFLEQNYAHLTGDEDWSLVFGPSAVKGMYTVRDIRAAVKGHPKHASIRLKDNGSGFYVSDLQTKFFVAQPTYSPAFGISVVDQEQTTRQLKTVPAGLA